MRKLLTIIAIVLAVANIAIIARTYDNDDYLEHERYATRNHCEWNYDEIGGWLVCD